MIHEFKIKKINFERALSENFPIMIDPNKEEFKIGDFIKKIEIDENENYTGKEEILEVINKIDITMNGYITIFLKRLSKEEKNNG